MAFGKKIKKKRSAEILPSTLPEPVEPPSRIWEPTIDLRFPAPTVEVEEPRLDDKPVEPPEPFTRLLEQDGAFTFMAGEEPVLKFCPNGKAYIRGELVENNRLLYEQVKQWFAKAVSNG